ncbi:phosphonate ABC transporter, permease protein PhnE [Falsiroseomonas sp. HW251]|uniref:phosphonate ABC transporter, permease protein PhnE n=1 Tax=Falsiroseomonas sp. HW251 TaxID=3390998 RepID=UPI003D319663
MDIALTSAALAARDPVARGETAFRQARRMRRRATLVACAVLFCCVLVAGWVSQVEPTTLADGIPRIGEYIWRTLPTLRQDVLFASWETDGSLAAWMYRLDKWAWLLFETSQMALLGTLVGTLAATLLCFVAARNLSPSPIAYQLARRFLEVCRTVPEIVYALIFVWAFGIGPLAGILAIIIHTVGANGKLFAEVVENIEPGPVEGVCAAGGGWFARVRFGALPQVLPNFLSYALLRFEINVRGASVIGFVGAGGIGEELYHVIAFNYYEEISAIVLLIVLTVASIDLLSERLRRNISAAVPSARKPWPAPLPHPLPRDLDALRAAMPAAFGATPAVRAARIGIGLGAIAWLGFLCWWFDITPNRIARGLSGLGTIVTLMIPPSPGELWREILWGMAESVAMAFLGTLVAATIAVPLGFLGAGNVVTNALAHFSVRRFLDGFRGIDQLIWALTYVRAVGLGPLAGVLAIATADIAVLAKLYAEAIENAERKQAEGIEAVGGSGLMRTRFGLLPQVLPVMLAQALYFFESNTRAATVLGVVGVGGIGLQLAERIKVRHWDEVAFIIILMIATVAVIDLISSRIRHALIGSRQGIAAH